LKARYLIVEPGLQFVVFSVDSAVARMCPKISFTAMKFALPSPIDVPIAHRALHEFWPNGVELEIVGVVVRTFVKLRRKIMGNDVQIGDAGPNPVI